MNNTTQQVLRHYLEVMQKQMEAIPTYSMSRFVQDFFLEKELRDIVQWKLSNKELQDIDIEMLSSSELLNMIGNDAVVLGYYFNQWDQECSLQESPEQKEIFKTLHQLGLHTHYLASKPMTNWDEYDWSNFRALQLKSGKLSKVYGIYGSRIRQEEVDTVTSPPARYYDTEEDAQEGIEELLTTGIFKPKELAIRYTYKGK